MSEQDIMSELISGGIRAYCAAIDILQAFIAIIIVLMSIVIAVFDIIIGLLMVWKACISLARLFLVQILKKKREEQLWNIQMG